MQVHSPNRNKNRIEEEDENEGDGPRNACNLPFPLSTRLDMDEDVADSGNLGADFVFHLMGDVMGMLDSHLRIHLDVHVCVEVVTHFPHESFFYALDAFYRLGNMANPFAQLAAGAAVH